MGSLLSESAADREVNSSWPTEGRRGGRWLMHALAYIWGLTLQPFSVIHSASLRTICHYLFVEFFALDNLVDSDEEVPLSKWGERGVWKLISGSEVSYVHTKAAIFFFKTAKLVHSERYCIFFSPLYTH